MTRTIFDRELRSLQDRVLGLGDEVAHNIEKSIDALLRQDDILAERLIRGDIEVNRAQVNLEEDCLTLIARQAPAAGDLRTIAAVMAVAGELERINDYAKGNAGISQLIGKQPLLAPALKLKPMAEKAADMLTRSLQALASRNIEQAYAIFAEDDEVDALYNEIYRDLLDLIVTDSSVIDQATHLLWAAHNVERTADRVGNICERVVFMVTGEIVETDEEMEVVSLD